MIRFSITVGNNEPVFTEWQNEPLRTGPVHTAVQRMSELRETYGRSAEISIERTTIIPETDKRLVRFKIDEGENKIRYSKPFPIAEQEIRMSEMVEQFPKATITPEVIKG